jgi:hypothetical protein
MSADGLAEEPAATPGNGGSQTEEPAVPSGGSNSSSTSQATTGPSSSTSQATTGPSSSTSQATTGPSTSDASVGDVTAGGGDGGTGIGVGQGGQGGRGGQGGQGGRGGDGGRAEQRQTQGQGQQQRATAGAESDQAQQQRATAGAESDQEQSAETGNNTTSIESEYTDESIHRDTAYGDLPGGISGCKVLKGRQGGIFIGIPGVFVIEPQVTWSEGDMIEGCHDAAMEELQARQSHEKQMEFLKQATKIAVETGDFTMVGLSIQEMAEDNDTMRHAWMKTQAVSACHYVAHQGQSYGIENANEHGVQGGFDFAAHSGMKFVDKSSLSSEQNRMMQSCLQQAMRKVQKSISENQAANNEQDNGQTDQAKRQEPVNLLEKRNGPE